MKEVPNNSCKATKTSLFRSLLFYNLNHGLYNLKLGLYNL